MARRHSRPPEYSDASCLEGGNTASFTDPVRPTERTTTNLPKETARMLELFSEATHIPIKEQILSAVDLYLKIHADSDESGEKLLPSHTHNRLQRFSVLLDTTEGWFGRIGTSLVCGLLEAPSGGERERLFDDLYARARQRKLRFVDCVVELLQAALRDAS